MKKKSKRTLKRTFFDKQSYKTKFSHNIVGFCIELILTFLVAGALFFIRLGIITQNASSFCQDIEWDYTVLMNQYVQTFKSVVLQIEDKIKENPTFEQLQDWLQENNERFKTAMGEDIYDGIALTYQGKYAHSWDYGDYTNYDATQRPWYQQAKEANGEVTIVAPYITYLGQDYIDPDEAIILTIAQKYNDEIYIDYDVKITDIRNLFERHGSTLFSDTQMFLYDQSGYVISTTEEKMFAHNILQKSSEMSSDFVSSVEQSKKAQEKLKLKFIDGKLSFIYSNTDARDNTLCVIFSFFSFFSNSVWLVCLFLLLMFGIEIMFFFYRRHSITGYDRRDTQFNAITNKVYMVHFFVDIDHLVFFGDEFAYKLFPTHSYYELFCDMRQDVMEENEKVVFDDFLAPYALRDKTISNELETKKFSMNWKERDGSIKPRIMEISRLFSIVDGRRTVAVLFKDVSEDVAILKDALKQAKIASLSKGEFLSRMSHEIRTPLNAVIGYLDIAKDTKNDPEKINHCISQSTVAAKHLLGLLNEILDISSIESGKMKIANDPFNLPQMVSSLSTIFYAQTQKKKINFVVDVADLTEEWLKGDSLRLNQVLLNLLSNSVKFTPEYGKISLSITQKGKKDQKVYIEFKVKDTGIGMSEEYLNRLFHPFEQESAATARQYGGTGLGLSISYNLIEMMGGKIEVQSKQGVGTTFTIVLAFGETTQKGEIVSNDSFSNLHALVVDDDETTCLYVQKILNRCGIKVDYVTSGKKAIHRIENRMNSSSAYDFCILDWVMPEMNGLETAKEIQTICKNKLPILIATSYDYSEIEEEAKKVGVTKIISKPLFQSSIFDMLVNIFGQYIPKKSEKKVEQNFNHLTVLLVEDNEMNLEIAQEILTKKQITVVCARNGKEALDTYLEKDENYFDAILMDILMPIMNGYEATRAIRKSGRKDSESIPIIAMTANAFTNDINEALAAGMNDHISKPISYDKLFDSLAKLTQK